MPPEFLKIFSNIRIYDYLLAQVILLPTPRTATCYMGEGGFETWVGFISFLLVHHSFSHYSRTSTWPCLLYRFPYMLCSTVLFPVFVSQHLDVEITCCEYFILGIWDQSLFIDIFYVKSSFFSEDMLLKSLCPQGIQVHITGVSFLVCALCTYEFQ